MKEDHGKVSSSLVGRDLWLEIVGVNKLVMVFPFFPEECVYTRESITTSGSRMVLPFAIHLIT